MRNPYSTYRGRTNWLRRILIAIVVLLVIALAAAIVGLFVLPNYVVYTPNGPQLVLPFFGGGKETATPAPTSGGAAPTSDIVIETSSPSPSPSPSPKVTPPPPPGSLPPRRDTPLGLTGFAWPRLLDGSAKESLAKGRGAIFSLADADLDDPDLIAEQYSLDLPYAAALVPFDPADSESAIATCQTLAYRCFDEVILTPAEGAAFSDGDAAFLADLRSALEECHFNGRISVVAEKAPFQNDTVLGRAMAEHLDRVYVPGGNWGGLNLFKYLKDNGFRGTTADIVTLVSKPISSNYAWAVLPE